MVRTVEIDVAQATLSEIIAGLGPGEEIVIVRNRQPVARIVPTRQASPRFGSCRGLLTIVEEDDEHLADFEEYMP
jgi:antitoxin (DNA-binding transcriptional repressor) of toxin-antitoxin stability system